VGINIIFVAKLKIGEQDISRPSHKQTTIKELQDPVNTLEAKTNNGIYSTLTETDIKYGAKLKIEEQDFSKPTQEQTIKRV
jgi:hypothetical protein